MIFDGRHYFLILFGESSPMDQQAAEIIFCVIMTVGACVWFLSLQKALKLGVRQVPPGSDPFAPFNSMPSESDSFRSANGFPTDDNNSDRQTGEKTVRGEPEAVCEALAKALLNSAVPGMFSSLYRVERFPGRLEVRKTGPLVCNQPSGMYFSEADFEFERAGEGMVRVTYCLGFERLARGLRRIALGLILFVGLPVLLLVGTIIWLLVVQHANPAVRWQVLQTLQIAHVLWPPFLMMYFYKAGRKHARTHIVNILASLSAVADFSRSDESSGPLMNADHS